MGDVYTGYEYPSTDNWQLGPELASRAPPPVWRQQEPPLYWRQQKSDGCFAGLRTFLPRPTNREEEMTISDEHLLGEPPILYFGTPVVLISSQNEDGSANLAPMSSAFWLGWRCILGLAASSRTTENLKRTGECVLNLPSDEQVHAVNRLALTTGSDPVPSYKAIRGYRHEKHKFAVARLTPVGSQTVAPPRARECPVHLEGKVVHWRDLAEDDDKVRGRIVIFEVRIQRVHLAPSIVGNGDPNRVDADKWRPLIMSFARFYGLAPEQLLDSTLAQVPEHLYRSPDVDTARSVAARVRAA
jgi:flavin reductase (DIM6/NTAB) family NADH-FMN oxidoreductase RutF